MRRERGQGRVYLYDCEFVHGLPLANRITAGMNPPAAVWFRINEAARLFIPPGAKKGWKSAANVRHTARTAVT